MINHDLPAHVEEEIRFDEGFYLAVRLREEDMHCPSCGQKGKLFDFCKDESCPQVKWSKTGGLPVETVTVSGIV
jgi:hypothetical protein